MIRTRTIVSLAIAAIAFSACSSSSSTGKPASTDTLVTGSAAPAAAMTVAFEENAQVELTSASGERVLIDVYDPTLLTSPDANVLLITHLHTDHYSVDFADAFTGPKIVNKAGDLTAGDIKVKSIAAAHDDTAINTTDPSNYIFIVEFGGFKIVHLGSTGQTKLTDEQLAAIGSGVDIAIGPLQNVGGLDPDKRKSVDVMDQIKPRIVIPTHSALDTVQLAAKEWKATYSSKLSVTIPKDQLPSETTMLCMGQLATSYGAILSVPESTW